MLSLSAYADTIRGPLSNTVQIDGSFKTEKDMFLSIEDILAFVIAEESPIHKGFEIEVSIPAVLKEFRDSFAVYMYKAVNPAPEKGILSYKGDRLLFYPLPQAGKVYFQMPLQNEVRLKASAGTRIVMTTYDAAQYPVLLTILPIMKGIPQAAFTARFPVKVRPLFLDIGFLQLAIESQDSGKAEDVNVLIDEKEIKDYREKIPLTVGLHSLKIISRNYREQALTFAIEKGDVSEIRVTLEKTSTQVVLEAPSDTVVYLDGKRVDVTNATPFGLEEGEHSVVFAIGDYRLTKKFYAQFGKTYKIALLMEIVIEEK